MFGFGATTSASLADQAGTRLHGAQPQIACGAPQLKGEVMRLFCIRVVCLVAALLGMASASHSETGDGGLTWPTEAVRPRQVGARSASDRGTASRSHKLVQTRRVRLAPAATPATRVARSKLVQTRRVSEPKPVTRVATKRKPTIRAAQISSTRLATSASHSTVRHSEIQNSAMKGGIKTALSPSSRAQAGEHRVVIQVSQNDSALMNMALNNAQNLVAHHQAKGENVQVEFVAYGPGLHMLRSDSSPVKERLSALASTTPSIVFSGCGNTMSGQSKQEGKDISLVSEARVVPTGIARILELQEQGWTYVRP